MLRRVIHWTSWSVLAACILAVLWPSAASPHDLEFIARPGLPPGGAARGTTFVLGTTRGGVDFITATTHAASASFQVALLGTLAVVLGSLIAGVGQGLSRSRLVTGMAQAMTLGTLTLPDIAIITTAYCALPRNCDALIKASVVTAALGMLWIPGNARLIGSRIRALRDMACVRASWISGASAWRVASRDFLPLLREDIAWLFAVVFPKFLHVEVGMTYLGLEPGYAGLGRLLRTTYENNACAPYVFQLTVLSVVTVLLAIGPQLVLRLAGARRGAT